jgi:hypothetical protein
MRTSKKTCNAVRRESNLNPTVAILIARQIGETQENRDIRVNAERLFAQLNKNGANWAACVQAVKTNWVPNLIGKFS